VQTAMKQVDEYKKGDSAAAAKIKALEEMQASKVKTLLKSINNLKKEIQKERFEKKDNVRIKKIEMLMKEHEDFEIAINALRKVINNEDKCDQAIT
jgi:predicted DNA-binding protein